MHNLKTDWVKIAQSGPTIDGREIKSSWLLDCAKHYDKSVYVAKIWPDHLHYVNYGTVEELKAVQKPDGTVDLFAILLPNENYVYDNRNGQLLSFSIELPPNPDNFAKTGHSYLVGLAATDMPASLGTADIHFSVQRFAFVADYTELTEVKFQEKDVERSFFEVCKQFFTKQPIEEDEMSAADKAKLEQLSADFKKLEDKLDGLDFAKKTDVKKDDGENTTATDEAFSKLNSRLDELEAKFSAKPSAPDTSEVTELKEQLKAFGAKLSAALQEQPGTKDDGDGEANKANNSYI